MHHAYRHRPDTVSRGLFIDRWGTLFERPRKGFLSSFDRVRFTPGALDALFMAGQAGWNLYLIGNEDSVAFGNLSQQKWETFERAMLAQLQKQGISITRNYACLENPAGEPPHNAESVFLLPNTGAFHHAAQVDGIDLRQSWVIGDSSLELVAGWRANCHLASVRTGESLKDGTFPVEPELSADNLAEALANLSQGFLSKAS